jgi:cell division septation protein DedD
LKELSMRALRDTRKGSPQLTPVLKSSITRWSAALGWVLLTTGLTVGSGFNQGAMAQNSACQPPRSNEYLLLVRNPQSDTQSKLRQLLPANAVLTPCTYGSGNSAESVVRVEGFASADVANAWAKYLSDQASLQAIVSSPNASGSSSNSAAAPNPPSTNSGAGTFPRPNTTPTTPTTPSTQPRPTNTDGTTYNPQPLGSGYAVLVSYFNRPEVAADVRKVTNRNVGLVSYEQRPYLLAAYGSERNAAEAVLNRLKQEDFVVTLVDSRGVVMLTANVRR